MNEILREHLLLIYGMQFFFILARYQFLVRNISIWSLMLINHHQKIFDQILILLLAFLFFINSRFMTSK